jgi:predicted HicB family RNase H-like nuclease
MNPQPSKPSKKAKTSLTLDAELLQRARDAAWASRVSLTSYMEAALEEYMERHPAPPMPGQ